MIHDSDRSGYIGGSDTRYVMMNRNTKTFKQWWSTKLGQPNDDINTIYTRAGNAYEHLILQAINEDIQMDGQIIYEKYKLRVNYDGWHKGVIYEVKTHKAENEFEVATSYWQQCQVEMYVYKEMSSKWFLPDFDKLYILSYGLNRDEYDLENGIHVDPNRIRHHLIEYDKNWIKGVYMPKLKELVRALKKEKFPR